MPLSQTWARRVLRASLDIEVLPAAAPLFIALLSAKPARAGAQADLPELDYPGYERIPVQQANAWNELRPYEYTNATELAIAPNTGVLAQIAWAFAVTTGTQRLTGESRWFGRVPGFEIHPDDPDPAIPAGALHLVLPDSV